MVYAFIQYARSGRTKCIVCQETIKLKEVRIGWHRSRYTPDDWHHVQCFIFAKRPFNDVQGHGMTGFKLNEMRIWDKFTESEFEEIRSVLAQWKDIRAKMVLPKCISQMKIAELKLELKQRNMSATGKKSELQKRLRKYLNTPWIEEEQKRRVDLETSGYCRRFEKEIPIVLIQIIKTYVPTGIRTL